jgi:cysteine-rich repeat protein
MLCSVYRYFLLILGVYGTSGLQQTYKLHGKCVGTPKQNLPCFNDFTSSGNTYYRFFFDEPGDEPIPTGSVTMVVQSQAMLKARSFSEIYITDTTSFAFYPSVNTPHTFKLTDDMSGSSSSFTICNDGEACIPCTENSIWDVSTRSCICPPNSFEIDTVEVTTTYDVIEDLSAEDEDVYYNGFTTSRVVCYQCPDYKRLEDGICVCEDDFLDYYGSCACAAGHAPLVNSSGAYCLTCPIGRYKSSVSNAMCSLCPPGESTTPDHTSCECPANRNFIITASDSSLTSYKTLYPARDHYRCVCGFHFVYNAELDQCDECSLTSYRYDASRDGICNLCPGITVRSMEPTWRWCVCPDPTTMRNVGTDRDPICACNTGLAFNEDKSSCVDWECATGMVKYSVDPDQITCVCQSGFIFNEAGTSCNSWSCPSDQFKLGLDPSTCTTCPAKEMPSSDSTVCECIPGAVATSTFESYIGQVVAGTWPSETLRCVCPSGFLFSQTDPTLGAFAVVNSNKHSIYSQVGEFGFITHDFSGLPVVEDKANLDVYVYRDGFPREMRTVAYRQGYIVPLLKGDPSDTVSTAYLYYDGITLWNNANWLVGDIVVLVEGAPLEYTCQQCPEDTFAGTPSDSACTPCPDNTHVPAGSTAGSYYGGVDCLCMLYESGDACGCYPGSSLNIETGGCDPCPYGYFKTGYDIKQCEECPEHSHTLYANGNWHIVGVDNIVCECDTGFQWNSFMTRDRCEPCPVGTYKPFTHLADVGTSCVPCPDGYFRDDVTSDGAICLPCAADAVSTNGGSCVVCDTAVSTPSVGLDVCVCFAEYTIIDEICVKCPDLTFKTTMGNQTCSPCVGDKIQAGMTTSRLRCGCIDGYFGLPQCESLDSCGPNAELVGNEGCFCKFAHEKSSGDVTVDQMTIDQMTVVAIDQMTVENQPERLVSFASLTLRSLDSGNTDHMSTISSVYHEWDISFGSRYISWNMGFSMHGKPGMIREGSTWVDLPAGKNLRSQFKITDGDDTYTYMGAPHYYNGVIVTDTFQKLSAGVDLLSYNASVWPFTMHYGPVVVSQQTPINMDVDWWLSFPAWQLPNEAEYYLNVTVSHCSPCPQHTYLDTGSGRCTSCPGNMGTPSEAYTESATGCVCPPGTFFSGTSGVCVKCPIDTFRVGYGLGSCVACPAHEQSTDGRSVCACRTGFDAIETFTDRLSRDPGNTLLTPRCLCSLGNSYDSVTDICVQCVGDTFSATRSLEEVCENCPQLHVAVVGKEQCKCAEGFMTVLGLCECAPANTLDPSTLVCVPCPVGTYKDVSGNEPCTSCGDGLDAFFDKRSCVCGVGYQRRQFQVQDIGVNVKLFHMELGGMLPSTGFHLVYMFRVGDSPTIPTIVEIQTFPGVTNELGVGVNDNVTITVCVRPLLTSLERFMDPRSWKNGDIITLTESDSCEACAEGTYKTATGSSACQPGVPGGCSAGLTYDDTIEECVVCPSDGTLRTTKRTKGMGACEVCSSDSYTGNSLVLCLAYCGAGEGRPSVVVESYYGNSSVFVFNNTNGIFTAGDVFDVDVVRDYYQQFWPDARSLWQAVSVVPGPGRLVMAWPFDDGSGLWYGRVHPLEAAQVGDWQINDYISLSTETGCEPCPAGTYHDKANHLEGCKLAPAGTAVGATSYSDQCRPNAVRELWTRECKCSGGYVLWSNYFFWNFAIQTHILQAKVVAMYEFSEATPTVDSSARGRHFGSYGGGTFDRPDGTLLLTAAMDRHSYVVAEEDTSANLEQIDELGLDIIMILGYVTMRHTYEAEWDDRLAQFSSGSLRMFDDMTELRFEIQDSVIRCPKEEGGSYQHHEIVFMYRVDIVTIYVNRRLCYSDTITENTGGNPPWLQLYVLRPRWHVYTWLWDNPYYPTIDVYWDYFHIYQYRPESSPDIYVPSDTCASCPIGYYTADTDYSIPNGEATTCIPCMGGRTTEYVGGSCVCPPGWQSVNSSVCTPCDPTDYSQDYSGVCKTCPDLHIANDTRTGCQCDTTNGFITTTELYPDTQPVGRERCSCHTGYAVDTLGVCKPCTENTYKVQGDPFQCSECPILSIPVANHTTCVCMVGTYAVGDTSPTPVASTDDYTSPRYAFTECKVCGWDQPDYRLRDKYKPEIGNTNTCLVCPPNGIITYTNDAYGTWPTGCVYCTGATFRKPLVSPCVQCPYNEDGDGTGLGCECTQDTFRNSDGNCVPCPPGTNKPSIGDAGCAAFNCDNYWESYDTYTGGDKTWSASQLRNYELNYAETDMDYFSTPLLRGPFVDITCGCGSGSFKKNETTTAMVLHSDSLDILRAINMFEKTCPSMKKVTVAYAFWTVQSRDLIQLFNIKHMTYTFPSSNSNIRVDLHPSGQVYVWTQAMSGSWISTGSTGPFVPPQNAWHHITIQMSQTDTGINIDILFDSVLVVSLDSPHGLSFDFLCNTAAVAGIGSFWDSTARIANMAVMSGLHTPYVMMRDLLHVDDLIARYMFTSTETMKHNNAIDGKELSYVRGNVATVDETQFYICSSCGESWVLSNGVCIQCHNSTITSPDLITNTDQCLCGVGMEYDTVSGIGCVPCGDLQFKVVGDSSRCKQCPQFERIDSTSNTVCTCHEGMIASMPFIEYITQDPSYSERRCSCEAGNLYLPAYQRCGLCEGNNVLSVRSVETTCTACHNNSIASSNHTRCLCDADFYGNETLLNSDGTIVCEACPPHASTNGTDLPDTCGCLAGWKRRSEFNSFAEYATKSSTADFCECDVGYGYDTQTDTCTICTNGTSKSTTGNDVCAPCLVRDHWVTLSSRTECACDAGYFLNTATATCDSCADIGGFRFYAAAEPCSFCADNEILNIQRQVCECEVGMGANAVRSLTLASGASAHQEIFSKEIPWESRFTFSIWNNAKYVSDVQHPRTVFMVSAYPGWTGSYLTIVYNGRDLQVKAGLVRSNQDLGESLTFSNVLTDELEWHHIAVHMYYRGNPDYSYTSRRSDHTLTVRVDDQAEQTRQVIITPYWFAMVFLGQHAPDWYPWDPREEYTWFLSESGLPATESQMAQVRIYNDVVAFDDVKYQIGYDKPSLMWAMDFTLIDHYPLRPSSYTGVVTYDYEQPPGFVVSQNCNGCPIGEYSRGGRYSSCETCTGGSTTFQVGSASCSCYAGQEIISIEGVCVDCGEDGYQPADGATECLSCPVYAESTTNRLDCHCAPGYFRVSTTCEPCAIGTAKGVFGNEQCTPCLPGYVSLNHSATACTPCVGDTFSLSTSSCVSCPLNESTNPEHTLCECDAEFSRNVSSNMCEWCSNLTFKPTQGDEDCLPCPHNSLNSEGGQQRIGCSCGVGRYFDMSALDCPLCAIGTYKSDVGNEMCTTCPAGLSTLALGSLTEEACICGEGHFINTILECEECPLDSYNPLAAAVGIGSCISCPFRMFQPTTGQSECVNQNNQLFQGLSASMNIVGLFVHGDTSCAYINKESGYGIDTLCWGEVTDTNPALTLDAFPGITPACGDGVLLIGVEQCDDGNFFNQDGCTAECVIEPGFICETRPATTNITDSLWTPSVCCRVHDGPPSHTPTCARCDSRAPLYPGVRFREHDCSLEDVDECAEGTDGCVQEAGHVSCMNRDAVESTEATRFECVCAPGTFPSDRGCTDERFATQFVVEFNRTEYPTNASAMVAYFTQQLVDDLLVDEGIRLLEMHVEEYSLSEYIWHIRCTLFTGSWVQMQEMTRHFNSTRLVELMQAGINTP